MSSSGLHPEKRNIPFVGSIFVKKDRPAYNNFCSVILMIFFVRHLHDVDDKLGSGNDYSPMFAYCTTLVWT